MGSGVESRHAVLQHCQSLDGFRIAILRGSIPLLEAGVAPGLPF